MYCRQQLSMSAVVGTRLVNIRSYGADSDERCSSEAAVVFSSAPMRAEYSESSLREGTQWSSGGSSAAATLMKNPLEESLEELLSGRASMRNSSSSCGSTFQSTASGSPVSVGRR